MKLFILILTIWCSATAYAEETTSVFAHINEAIMPDERASKYEDPLDEFLKAKGIGEVTGGGTMQSESGEILWVGVDIELINLENNLALLVNEFRELGAPRGSFLQYTFKGVPQKTPIR